MYGLTISEQLVGKKIEKIFINSEYLKFQTDKGDFTYRVEGDCCSHSYFYDFYGVKNLLENGVVKEVKTVELHTPDALVTDSWESIQVYGYQITVESPTWGDVTAVFSFRNSSNGYYGGWMEDTENREVLPEVKDDVKFIKNEDDV